MTKVVKYICISIAVLVVMFFVSLMIPWIIVGVEMEVQDYKISQREIPPDPIITFGEFPYILEYTLDGEVIRLDGEVACEYTGVDSFKVRTWKASERFIDVFEGQYGDEYITVKFLLPKANEYMGDSETIVNEETIPHIYLYGNVAN